MKRFIKSFLLPIFIFLTASCFNTTNIKSIKKKKESDNSTSLVLKMIDLGTNGDCTLIIVGNIQILIDCGGTADSWTKIQAELDNAMPEDDKLFDYVIFSHGDSDHIVNFANGTYSLFPTKAKIKTDEKKCLSSWVINNGYKIGTFIDFDPTLDTTLKDLRYKNSLYTTENDDQEEGSSGEIKLKETYSRYKNARNYMKKYKFIENYYTNSQCLSKFRDDMDDDGKKKNKDFTNKFQFSSSPKGTIEILDNYYAYHSYASGKPNGISRNIIATCVLIKYDGYKYLFTGDLPEFQSGGTVSRTSPTRKELKKTLGPIKPGLDSLGAESVLVERNYKELKDGVLFFKAGHHGSFSSNSDNLLNIIKPQYIGISCAAGGQYDFPKDVALSTMCQYTDKIYLTSYKDVENESKILHGTVTFTYKAKLKNYDELLDVTYENMSAPKSILGNNIIWKLRDDVKQPQGKEKKTENRRFPIRTIELSSADLGVVPNDCTYIKTGHIDILINDGVLDGRKNGSAEINGKIQKLCNDHVLDYLIVTTQHLECFSNLNGENGLLTSKSSIKQINNLIINPVCGQDLQKNVAVEQLAKDISHSTIPIRNMYGFENGKFSSLRDTNLPIKYGNTSIGNINILTRAGAEGESYTYATSLGVNVNLMNGAFNYLNLGTCYDSQKNENLIARLNKRNPITLMTLPHFGYLPTEDDNKYFNELKKKSSNLGVLVNAPWGSINNSKESLYPSAHWGKTNGELSAFRANKFVDGRSGKNRLNTNKSYIDIEAITNYPISTKENLQYRYVYQSNTIALKNNPYFSFYGIEQPKMSDYTNTFLNTVSVDNYAGYLSIVSK